MLCLFFLGKLGLSPVSISFALNFAAALIDAPLRKSFLLCLYFRDVEVEFECRVPFNLGRLYFSPSGKFTVRIGFSFTMIGCDHLLGQTIFSRSSHVLLRYFAVLGGCAHQRIANQANRLRLHFFIFIVGLLID